MPEKNTLLTWLLPLGIAVVLVLFGALLLASRESW